MSLLQLISLGVVGGYIALVSSALVAPRVSRLPPSGSVWLVIVALFPVASVFLLFLLGPRTLPLLSYISATVTISHWLLVLVALFIIPVNRKPSSATAWLLVITLLPLLGLVVFLLIGSPKLPAERRLRQRKMDELVADVVRDVAGRPGLGPLYAPEVPEAFEPYARLSAELGGLPAFAGNRVEAIPEYAEVLRRIAEDIDRAESFVHIQFYILSRDEETEGVFAAMERAQARGVTVRVLYDQIGSRKYPSRQPTDASMAAAGIAYHRILPFSPFRGTWSRPDLRNHRKIVVIDGAVGYTGSMNLIKRGYFRKDELYYDELVVRVAGPVVAQLSAVFVTDWYCETGQVLGVDDSPAVRTAPLEAGPTLCQVLPSGSGHDDENNLKLFTSLIHGARRRLVIVNPYFVPDDALMTAITSAAQRGVDVVMLNSEGPDQFMVYHAQRSFYDELLRCGVRIFLYREPILLHSKFMTIDDEIAMVGSSNFDMRSFHLNLEVSLVCFDGEVVRQLRAVEDAYLARSLSLTREEWARRPWRVRLFENLMRLTAALQ